jgi:hypothetical protein
MLIKPDSAFVSQPPSQLWTNNTVPYVIDPAIPNPTRIMDAITYYNQNTPLKWQARTNEANFVHYMRSTVGDGVCYSSVGMIGGEQFIHVEDTCGEPTMIHEMGHTVGFYHEHERRDRNRHVTVRFENIDKNQFGEFNIASAGQDAAAYEYASLMHYAPFEFSKDGLPVMDTVSAGIPFHTYTVFSPGDLDTLFRMYGAAPASTTVASNPPGLQLTVDGAVVASPQKFNWAPRSTHTLSANTRHRDGFAVWAKRLEEGTYAMPFDKENESRHEITAQELGALLSGIDLSSAKRRKRYHRTCTEAA